MPLVLQGRMEDGLLLQHKCNRASAVSLSGNTILIAFQNSDRLQRQIIRSLLIISSCFFATTLPARVLKRDHAFDFRSRWPPLSWTY